MIEFPQESRLSAYFPRIFSCHVGRGVQTHCESRQSLKHKPVPWQCRHRVQKCYYKRPPDGVAVFVPITPVSPFVCGSRGDRGVDLGAGVVGDDLAWMLRRRLKNDHFRMTTIVSCMQGRVFGGTPKTAGKMPARPIFQAAGCTSAWMRPPGSRRGNGP